MSVDLFVYSETPNVIQRAALAEALLRKGWHALFLDYGERTELKDGPLSNDLVYGAKNALALKTVRDLLVKGDEKKLEELFENEDVGGVAVSADAPFDPSETCGEDLEQQVGPEIAAHVLKAKSHYNVTSGAHTELSYELHTVVWKTLGELAGGLLEDPQTGRYILFGPQGERVLAEPDFSEGSPLGDLNKYFQAAKSAGFPVEATKDDVSLNTVKLAPADLERLLKFTRDYFPSQDPSGSAMVMMILEEYQRKKGKSFAREYAPWFAQMQETYGQFNF